MIKECPYCAEEIKDKAIKCKHCGEWLNTNEETSQENSNAQDRLKEIQNQLDAYLKKDSKEEKSRPILNEIKEQGEQLEEKQDSLPKDLWNRFKFGKNLEPHPMFGKGILERGKTKKFRFYEKGFTFKKRSVYKEILWSQIQKVEWWWIKDTFNFGGSEELELTFYYDDPSAGEYYERLKITFSTPVLGITLDRTGKNKTILNLLQYGSEIFGFKMNER